ncbi:uncharacterized protein NPIL_495171 [Nephila pilipes]|uniref:Uncharacterized protein n=1 Tax=Nephila pilipes TaxID=299642 RepID=A0A8X6IJL2_NEPPI|nr:uncharacterized protein NPIL_495171 [Nephila pilipes]
MLEGIDGFHQEIDARCDDIEYISDRFAVLEPINLIETSESELPKFKLVEIFDELSVVGILTEISCLRRFLKVTKVLKEK